MLIPWRVHFECYFFVECTNVPSIFQEVVRLDEGDVFATRNVSLGMTIWVFPQIVVPPKHPKMIIFSRKTNQ